MPALRPGAHCVLEVRSGTRYAYGDIPSSAVRAIFGRMLSSPPRIGNEVVSSL
jgi:hypothetical protein